MAEDNNRGRYDDGMFEDAFDREAGRRFAEEDRYEPSQTEPEYAEDLSMKEGLGLLMSQKRMFILLTSAVVLVVVLMILQGVGVIPRTVLRIASLVIAAAALLFFLGVKGRQS